jgi:hypothetical protein
MEKIEFIEKAPQYYALAVTIFLRRNEGKLLTIADFSTSSLTKTGYNHFTADLLLRRALELLSTHGVLEIITDDFGPTLYRSSSVLSQWAKEDALRIFPLFDKYNQIQSMDWLVAALMGVNSQFGSLDIQESDFGNKLEELQWEPIPLERTNEKLIAATTALDEAIEQIEQNNGYATTAPGEREHVLENLKAATKSLKERGHIYWAQLRSWAMEPLTRVVNRFGNAAVGVSSSAAKEALIDWLKSLIENGFPNIF